MRNNYTNKDYTVHSNVYQLKLPLELDGLVPNDDSVRLLSQILEELDYTKLYQDYSTKVEIQQLTQRPCLRYWFMCILKISTVHIRLKLPAGEISTLCGF